MHEFNNNNAYTLTTHINIVVCAVCFDIIFQMEIA